MNIFKTTRRVDTQKGQAALVMVLVVGLVAVLTANALSSVLVGGIITETEVRKADASLYAAWAGVDELMYRLRAEQEFPNPGVYEVAFELANGATVSATIEGDATLKTVKSTGYFENSSRSIEVMVQNPGSRANFVYATQSGEGGFEMEVQTIVVGKDATDGNVYSNGDILGDSRSSGNSGSKILGSLWAVGRVDSLSGQVNGGVYTQKDAWAGELLQCLVGEDRISPLTPASSCTGGNYVVTNAPAPATLATIDVDYWKSLAEAGGVINGNCIVGGGAADCTGGTNTLGPVRINGDLTLEQNRTLTINGALWVDGDIIFSSNNDVIVGEPWNKQTAVVIVSSSTQPSVKGKVITSSNVDFLRNSQDAGIIVISQNTSQDCAAPAIDISSNTKTVVFIAIDGCVNVGANSAMAGILGYKVHIERNSTIEFDPSLAQAVVGSELNGWKVISVKEF